MEGEGGGRKRNISYIGGKYDSRSDLEDVVLIVSCKA
jgi:hypothetical protein